MASELSSSSDPAARPRPAHHSGRITGQVLIVVALGMLVGAADSWIRPVKLSASDPAANRVTPPVEGPDAGPGVAAVPDGKPAPVPPGPALAPAPGSAPAAAPEEAVAPLGLHINLAQARQLFERGTPFLDARTEEEFRAGHIAGAFHLPSDAFTRGGDVEALRYLDQNAPVVIYCGGGDCHASEYVAIELEKAGFKSYHIMVDGFGAWREAGYDTAAGAQ